MCYSFNTSLLSYSLGIISAIFCFFTRQYVLGMLILCYSQMQLSEMIIWYGIDHDNDKINKVGTSVGKYLLPMHNIAIGIGVILSVFFLSKKKLDFKDFIPLLVGVLFYIFVVVAYYSRKVFPSTTQPLDPESCKIDKFRCQNSKNRLQWPYPHGWYSISFVISMLITYFYIHPLKLKLWLMGVFTITFMISLLFVSEKAVGSIWCFSTALLAPVISIGGYLLTRNETNILA